MSALPYIAPWQAVLERFSTQVYDFQTVTTNLLKTVIPDGQWWRIIYVNVHYATGAGVGARQVTLEIDEQFPTPEFKVASPLTLAANQQATYLFAPGVSSFANTTDPIRQYADSAIPDVLWAPKSTILVTAEAALGGDDWLPPQKIAVEIYTENTPGQEMSLPTPVLL